MENLPDGRVVVKEFGPEQAGERVGWVAVEDSAVDPDITFVHIMTATVGDRGAKYGYQPIKHGSMVAEFHPGDVMNGLSAAASMTIPINRASLDIDPHAFIGQAASNSVSELSILSSSIPFMDSSHGLQYLGENWASNAIELNELLKSRLSGAELMQYYPAIYYAMNMAFMHEKTMPQSNTYSSPDFAIADPTMAELTVLEIFKALDIQDHLKSTVMTDGSMLSSLNEPASLTIPDLMECFRASRYHVRQAEVAAREVKQSMKTPYCVLLPIRAVQTWPYMDPEVEGESGYAVELTAIKNQDFSPVARALEKERRSNGKRIEFAAMGISALRLLHYAEVSLAGE